MSDDKKKRISDLMDEVEKKDPEAFKLMVNLFEHFAKAVSEKKHDEEHPTKPPPHS